MGAGCVVEAKKFYQAMNILQSLIQAQSSGCMVSE